MRRQQMLGLMQRTTAEPCASIPVPSFAPTMCSVSHSVDRLEGRNRLYTLGSWQAWLPSVSSASAVR